MDDLTLDEAVEILDKQPDVVYKLDPEGIITYINPAIKQFGYEPQELTGKHIRVLIHPDDFEKVTRKTYLGKKAPGTQVVDERRTGERMTTNLEVRILPKNELPKLVEITAEVNACGHYTNGARKGNLKGTIGTIRDVSKRKKEEEKKYVRRRTESLTHLARGVAHDINNIIAAINGNLGLLNTGDNLTDDQRDKIKAAQEAVSVASDLTSKLKLFSEGKPSEKKNIDVYKIAEKALGLVQQEGIEKIIDFPPNVFYAFISKSDFEEIMLNLVTNAADAIEDKGFIKIGAAYVNDQVYISVEDNGSGMSNEVRIHAFEPAFTTKPRTGKRGQGLGLGIVYSLVKNENNGEIDLDSVEGKGTKFHIYLLKGK
jgi:PAS domain S-box-containing protein